jgi:hypothetical protein
MGGIDLDAEGDPAVHRDRQRLRPAHATEPGGHRDRSRQGSAEAAPGDLREALVGPLDDALASDVDPGAGGHLAVHGQALRLEAAELVPVVPVADQVRVGDQDAWRPRMGPEDADRLPGLDEQGLVFTQLTQRSHDRVKRLPRARGPPPAPVDDQLIRVLGDLGVEVVHQHP